MRLPRAAIFAFTTLGIAASGCPRQPEPVMQPYGAPPTPPSPDTGVADSEQASPSVMPPAALYGAAPPPNQ
jgi:hypothetical protein